MIWFGKESLNNDWIRGVDQQHGWDPDFAGTLKGIKIRIYLWKRTKLASATKYLVTQICCWVYTSEIDRDPDSVLIYTGLGIQFRCTVWNTLTMSLSLFCILHVVQCKCRNEAINRVNGWLIANAFITRRIVLQLNSTYSTVCYLPRYKKA